jgi:hypothetical protein
MGNNSDPITLHKYLYANADPTNVTDPSGQFGLVSLGVANNIRMTLTNLQTNVGMDLLGAALDPDAAAEGPNFKLLGLGTIGGASAFKLLRLLSSKFRKFCGTNKCEFESEKLGKVWDHIFYGTFGKGRTLSGLHHAAGGVMPSGVFIEPIFGQRKMGFYKARIYRVGANGGLRRKTSNPGGISTMFPDTWPQSQVKAVATSAYIKYRYTGNPAVSLDSILGSKYKGITINVMMDGKTPSIFPSF